MKTTCLCRCERTAGWRTGRGDEAPSATWFRLRCESSTWGVARTRGGKIVSRAYRHGTTITTRPPHLDRARTCTYTDAIKSRQGHLGRLDGDSGRAAGAIR